MKKKITITVLKKAVKENIYLSSLKELKHNEISLTLVGDEFIVTFYIHGDNQQWLSFNVKGSLNYRWCEELVTIMNCLEGNE